MPARIEIKGTAEFRRTAARLKAAGDRKLTREMVKRMKVAVRPALEATQREVRGLDVKGVRGGGGQQRREFALSRKKKITERAKVTSFANRGLRNSVAKATKSLVKTGGRSAGVNIRARASLMPRDQKKLPKYLNAGKWRHPVFGNRKNWVEQVAPPGWFDRPTRAHGPLIRNNAVKALDDINKQIVG